MGAEIDTAAAVQANIDRTMLVLTYRIDRASRYALTASDTLLFTDDDPAPLALTESAGRAGSDTRRRVTAKADKGHETGGQPTGRMDTNTGAGPGNLLMNQPGAGQRTGMTANTTFDSRGG